LGSQDPATIRNILAEQPIQVIGSICLTALNWVLTKHGAGRHLLAQNPEDLGLSFKLGFAGRIMYQVSLVTTKLAICTFYLRVFQDRWSKIFVWSVIGCVLAYGVPFVLFPFFACRPIEGADVSFLLKALNDDY
jgi:hypothetical protein